MADPYAKNDPCRAVAGFANGDITGGLLACFVASFWSPHGHFDARYQLPLKRRAQRRPAAGLNSNRRNPPLGLRVRGPWLGEQASLHEGLAVRPGRGDRLEAARQGDRLHRLPRVQQAWSRPEDLRGGTGDHRTRRVLVPPTDERHRKQGQGPLTPGEEGLGGSHPSRGTRSLPQVELRKVPAGEDPAAGGPQAHGPSRTHWYNVAERYREQIAETI